VQFGVTGTGGSGPDGSWGEGFRPAMWLQPEIRVRPSLDCQGLGWRTVSAPPPGTLVYPSEASSFDCRLVTGSSLPFTHTRTRLVVTPTPGNIGKGEPAFSDQYGLGYGVQFPVTPPGSAVNLPLTASLLWAGGLVVGIAPNTILSGVDLSGYFECGAACRDFGLDGGSLQLVSKASGAKKVTWTYSDGGSGDGVGLKVVQKSFDGRPPADYVLFKFAFTNTSPAKRTFYAGFFGDWDLSDDGSAANDFGLTALGGRLMYVTNQGDAGLHVGTLLLGDFPISGTSFFGAESNGMSLGDQLGALSGTFKQTSFGPVDIRAIHAMGPITLKPKKSAVIWIAVVAGESKDQLLANAAAAKADVNARGDDEED
jgi:hypothetical protein